ncbi:MAG: capsule biosynthesis protein [Mailhella sp.]|nr:capsule biosynthesis protein [Mailhella sp.]
MFLKAPGSTGNDAYIINDYIQRLDIAQDIDRELGVVKHYSSRKHDIISRLWQNPTQDEFLTFWQRVVVPHLNVDTGIIELKVRAYDPQMAQKITRAVIARSEALVNAMNERAQGDAVKLAREEVARAEGRIRAAQTAMRDFRDKHDLLDPTITASGLLQLVTTLEAEASALRTQITEAQSFMRHDAPALTSLNQRLAAVEKQLAAEKARVAGRKSDNLNAIVAEYQDLTIEAEFAQKQLVSAMASLEQARIQQAAQSRYVVAYQQPTLPDESLYPRPYLFTLYIFLGTLILLGIVSLIWASIREHAGF